MVTHSDNLLSELSSTVSSTRWFETAQLGIASSNAFTMSLTLCATSEICATCLGFAQCCLGRWCLVHRLPALLSLFKLPLSTCLGTSCGGGQTIASSSSTCLLKAQSFVCFALSLTAVATSLSCRAAHFNFSCESDNHSSRGSFGTLVSFVRSMLCSNCIIPSRLSQNLH